MSDDSQNKVSPQTIEQVYKPMDRRTFLKGTAGAMLGMAGLVAALKPLLGKIDIATMREANLRASGNDANSSPDAVARWLWEKVGQR